MTEWYDNKALYEMQVELSKKMEELSAELAKTQLIIRDYNGLREKINHVEKNIREIAGQRTGSKDMWGYVVGGIGLLVAWLGFTLNR